MIFADDTQISLSCLVSELDRDIDLIAHDPTLTAMDIGRISHLCPTISQGRFRDIQQDIL